MRFSVRFSVPFLLASLVAVSAAAQSPAPLPAGSAHFSIVQDNKTVGETACDISALSSGWQVNSRGHVDKYKFSFTNANKLDTSLNIVRDQLSGSVKGSSVTFSMNSDSTGRQFNVSINAGGKTTSTTFDRHQRTVLLADLDAAAYVEMAHFALLHPQTSWAVIPKGEGVLVPSDYEPQPDAQGAWNGKTLSVHHTSVVVSSENGITVEIYYTGDGTLLEADLPEQNFWVIRDGFTLQNRPKYQPPHGTAPPAQNQQQGQPGQQQGPPQYQAPQGGYPQVQPQ